MASSLGNDLGSAYLAGVQDLRQAGLLRNPIGARAFVLGRLPNFDCVHRAIRGQRTLESYGLRSLVSWPESGGHLITFASSRSGKGVGFIIPNLATYPGSILVSDPKGENYEVTSAARRKLKQRVICLDPFGSCKNVPAAERGTFNPLDLLPLNATSDDRWELARTIAEAMVIRTPDAKDPHWDDKAETLLAHFIFFVLEYHEQFEPHKRHLGTVRDLVTAANQDHRLRNTFLKDFCRRYPQHPATRQLGRGITFFENIAPAELMSVMSSAERHSSFLDSQKVVAVLSRSTFDMADLKTKGNLSVYMVLPNDKLKRNARLLRVWITAAIQVMQRSRSNTNDRNVLFMLDEMAQLGPMPLFETAVSLLAGYGVTMWMIYQDLAQLKRDYPVSHDTFLANSKVQIYFGIADPTTASHVAEVVGKTTVDIQNISSARTHGWGTNSSHQSSAQGGGSGGGSSYHSSTTNTSGISSQERYLISKEEIMKLSNDYAIVCFPNACPPVILRRLLYHKDPLFADRCPTPENRAVVGRENERIAFELLRSALPLGLGNLASRMVWPEAAKGNFSRPPLLIRAAAASGRAGSISFPILALLLWLLCASMGLYALVSLNFRG